MDTTLWIIILAIGILVVAGAAFFVGQNFRKNHAEKLIGSAEEEATRIMNQALTDGENKRKEKILEAKDEIYKQRQEAEKEIRERRGEVHRQEKRINSKEDNIDRKIANIEKKEEVLQEKLKTVDEKLEEVEALKKGQFEMLEKISELTKEQAKEQLLKNLDGELEHEKALKIEEYKNRFTDESENIARELLSVAIQRCAVDHSSDSVVTVISLPNDETKGRIIGREGRNIRAIESMTGVNLVIDDTPEAITISSFDPVRRQVASLALQKLISDGRIHPARIEETVKKCQKEVDTAIKQAGDRAVLEVGVTGINNEVVKLLGRLKYRTSYGQNVLNHSVEVAYLSGLIASEMGVNVKLAKRAGLLHDIGKAIDHEYDGSHVQLGVEFAKKYKENDTVVNAIAAHHGDVEPKSTIAFIVQVADAISASRPGARRENIENYIKRIESLEEIASSFEGVKNTFALHAGREIRVMVQPESISDDKMVIVAHEISKKIEDELEYPGQIKVNVIRENRAVDYAK
ncbi:MAG: ribonuclease Y [Clostridia bacterium]|nr:ribonuclease Y [Clostridia bacterium]